MQALDRFICGPDRVGHEPEIDQSSQVTIPFRYLGGSGCVLHHCDFKPRFQQFVHVRLRTQVGRHSGEDYLVDLLIKQLWAFDGARIAVCFAYKSHDDSGNWFRSYGNENWEFDENGLMSRRLASMITLLKNRNENTTGRV